MLTPEVMAALAAVGGVLLRHFVPSLKQWLPARPSDTPAPVVPAPAPASAASKEVVAALEWALRAQVLRTAAGVKLSDADAAAVKSLDSILHVLLEAK
jgi:hypothetical protein